MKNQVNTDVENSVNGRVQKANHLAQFFQTLCMLSLTLVVGGYFVLQDPFWFTVWTVSWLVIAMVAFSFALHHGVQALEVYRTTKFEINDQRLGTLRITKTPVDVMTALESLPPGKYTGEGEFFNQLADMVGTERCAELRPKIFKYTKVG